MQVRAAFHAANLHLSSPLNPKSERQNVGVLRFLLCLLVRAHVSARTWINSFSVRNLRRWELVL
jgi:hypothetical protein